MASTTPRRERVERGIYKRPGTKPIVYEITFTDSDGRQCWRTVEGGLGDARAARGEIVGKLGKGERVVSSRITVSEYAAEWIEAQQGRLRPGTLRGYRDHLRLHIEPRIGSRRLASVTVDDVAALLGDLQRKRHVRGKDKDGKPVEVAYASWTIRGTLTTLGRLFGSAARRGLIPANPVAQLERSERPKVERASFPSLDREAVGRLIAATPVKYRCLVAVSVLLGVRQSEALGLTWQDVDTREGVIRVRHQLGRDGASLVEPKTAAAKRDIPVPPSLSKMLAEHKLASLHAGESDFVFCSSAGTPLQVRNIRRRGLHVALAKAGLPAMRWHDLRHVAASLLIAEGASVGYVSRLLGHASPAITLSTYAHAFAQAEHDTATRERMEAAFGDVLSGKNVESTDGDRRRTGPAGDEAKPAPLRHIGTGGD